MRSRGWTRKGGVQRRRGEPEGAHGRWVYRERTRCRACSVQPSIISHHAESSRHVASPCWRRGVCEWVLHSISGTCTGAPTCCEKFCFEFLHFYSCWQFLASFIFQVVSLFHYLFYSGSYLPSAFQFVYFLPLSVSLLLCFPSVSQCLRLIPLSLFGLSGGFQDNQHALCISFCLTWCHLHLYPVVAQKHFSKKAFGLFF